MKKGSRLMLFALAAVLCAFLCVAAGQPAYAAYGDAAQEDSPDGGQTLRFPDVDTGDEVSVAVEFWADLGVIAGFEDGLFHPDYPITRAQAAKLISVIFALPPGDGESFTDVSSTSWALPYIQAVKKAGIMIGYGDGTFQPNSPINRQEAIAVIQRLSTIAETSTEFLEAVLDCDDIDVWAQKSAAAIIQKGIVDPDENGMLRPRANASRAEFTMMLYRLDQADAWAQINTCILTGPTWTWEEGGVTLGTQQLSAGRILVLPAGADLDNLVLDLGQGLENAAITISGNAGSVLGMPFKLSDVAEPDEQGIYSLTAKTLCGGEHPELDFQLMVSEGVGAMFLFSDPEAGQGRTFVDAAKNNAITGEMKMLGADGSPVYDGPLTQIKSRGNSTFFSYPKKSYQIKLDKKTDLLGVGEKVKTWTLLAEFGDATLSRDKLCKDLASAFGLPGTASCDWVDLFFDGKYRGTYLLSEKVKAGSDGVDITDLEAMYEEVNPDYGQNPELKTGTNAYGNEFQYAGGLTDPEDISQGYLLEVNGTRGDDDCWFKTSTGRAVNIKAPEHLSERAMRYISERFQEMEDTVYAVYGGKEPGALSDAAAKAAASDNTDWEQYLDLDSFARMFLLYYFSDNKDSYEHSTFYYLENGKFYAGPIWDSDQTFGLEWESEPPVTHEIDSYKHMVTPLMQYSAFRSAVKELYDSQFRALAMDCAENRVPACAAALAGSERINHQLWTDYYQIAGGERIYKESVTFPSICEIMSQWMLGRISFMDEKFASW